MGRHPELTIPPGAIGWNFCRKNLVEECLGQIGELAGPVKGRTWSTCVFEREENDFGNLVLVQDRTKKAAQRP